jgi:predicted nucleic acid-binding protein
LGRIARLDLLPALAEHVVVPRAVLTELMVKQGEDWLARTVSSFPGIEVVADAPISADVRRWNLGSGESSVVAFCLANSGYRAVLDDLRGRRCAQALGVPLFGTLGVGRKRYCDGSDLS